MNMYKVYTVCRFCIPQNTTGIKETFVLNNIHFPSFITPNLHAHYLFYFYNFAFLKLSAYNILWCDQNYDIYNTIWLNFSCRLPYPINLSDTLRHNHQSQSKTFRPQLFLKEFKDCVYVALFETSHITSQPFDLYVNNSEQRKSIC